MTNIQCKNAPSQCAMYSFIWLEYFGGSRSLLSYTLFDNKVFLSKSIVVRTKISTEWIPVRKIEFTLIEQMRYCIWNSLTNVISKQKKIYPTEPQEHEMN